MNKLKALLSLEFGSFYGINKLIHTKDVKTKRNGILVVSSILIIAVMAFVYVGSLSYGLVSLGLSQVVPTYLVVISSVLIIIFGMFKAGNRIFCKIGYDMLSSMPVKSSLVVISRFITMYVEDLILTLIIMLPGLGVYAWLVKPNLVFYLVSILSVVFIPILPLVLSTFLGTIITAISSKMKKKSIVQTLLMVIVVLGIMVVSFTLGNATENLSPESLTQLANSLATIFGKIYLPSIWISSAVNGVNFLGLLVFIGISIIAFVLVIFLASVLYDGIIQGLNNQTAKHDYKLKTLKNGGMLKALYIRELKSYFSSTIYVTNTIISPIMALIASVVVCVIGVENIIGDIPIPVPVASLAPFLISAIFCFMPTTPTSISMEGKNFWLIKSLPVPTKKLFDSKILLNLTLAAPCYLISEILMFIALKPDAINALWLIIIPAILIIFTLVMGLTINIKFHDFDWEKEEQEVKQSINAFLGGFIGPILSLILFGLTFIVPSQFIDVYRIILTGTLILITVLLYVKNNKIKLENL